MINSDVELLHGWQWLRLWLVICCGEINREAGGGFISPVTHACKVSLISEHSLHDQGLWLVSHHPGTEEEEGEGKHVDCE